jgi:hypothetical protein
LIAAIETEALKFRVGLVAQTKEAVIGLARYVFGGPLTLFFRGKTESVEEMKDLVKAEFDRRGDAERHLELALPVLDLHASKIADEARKTISARPKVSEPVPLKKSVNKGKKAPDVDLPGTT